MLCFTGGNLAERRYRRSGLMLMLSYFLTFFGVTFLVHYYHPTGFRLYFAALLPSLPIFGVLFIAGRYLREETDEYQRDTFVRSLLWGIAFVMGLEMFLGFLRTYGWTGTPPAFLSYYVFCISVLVAKFTYKFRNRIPTDDQ